MRTHKVKRPTVWLVAEDSGPESGEPLMLVHGWPDSPRTWDKVLPALHAAGYRTVVPYLRGYGPAAFRDPWLGRKSRRTGQPVAFAQDVIDLADHLGLKRFHYAGHDWGARTGYALSALFPGRLKAMIAISVPFAPGKAKPPEFPQARAFWYQWLLCSNPGEEKFRKDPSAFGKAQWDAWSPKGWYQSDDLAAAAKSWKGKDFEDVVLHSYRSRWGHANLDPKYDKQQTCFEAAQTLTTPTLLLHGVDDTCELLATTEGAEKYFTGGYRRDLLEGAGHFPQREKPEATAAAILRHMREYSLS